MSTSGSEDLISQLLHPVVRRFIEEHASSDVHALSLKVDSVNGVPFARIAEQIAGRQKAAAKLPQYVDAGGILYPPALNLEQSSSERTARFKTELLVAGDLAGYHSCADLTGGFGVDALYLSRIFTTLHFVEPDARLLALARHNHTCLGRDNIFYCDSDAESFLRATDKQFDLVYVDPSRRPGGAGKAIEITGYAPDVRTLMPLALAHSRFCLLKASPMLDIQRGLAILPHVKKVVVVAVKSEVRELLFLSDRQYTDEPRIEAVHLSKASDETFSFYRRDEQATAVEYAGPQRYIYEPNASILKAGAFKLIAARFHLAKLHRNTHFYTSGELVVDFPGRVFEVHAVATRMTPELNRYFSEGKANVVVRNYPLTAEQLKTKAGLRDGGSQYLLGFTTTGGKMLAAAGRIR